MVNRGKIALLQDVVPDTFFMRHDQDKLKKKLGVLPERRIVLYTGSLLPGKGVQHVLEAMRILLGKRSDLFFVMVGYPVEEAQVFLEKHDLADQVSLPGQVAYGDLPQWLAVGDIALEPKEEESGEASCKSLHYMAAGLPVVCFETLNNKALLGDLGLYAGEVSSQSFADTMEQALALEKEDLKRKGRAGRRLIEQEFSTRAIGRILQDKYETLSRKTG
jgi:glycosyltransferase involved in cell wall biosynthesis